MYKEQLIEVTQDLVNYCSWTLPATARENSDGTVTIMMPISGSIPAIQYDALQELRAELIEKGFGCEITPAANSSVTITLPNTLDSITELKKMSRDMLLEEVEADIEHAYTLAHDDLSRVMPKQEVTSTLAKILAGLQPQEVERKR